MQNNGHYIVQGHSSLSRSSIGASRKLVWDFLLGNN